MNLEVPEIRCIKFDLMGATAIITGGASGVGRATAEIMVRSNANVIIADCNDEGQGIADKINSKYERTCLFKKTDVTYEPDVRDVVALAVDQFGSLDIAVCSAAISGDHNDIANETIENWNNVNCVDNTGVMLMNKHAINQFLAQDSGGVICNLASIFGLVAAPSNIAYSAAKGAVINLTKAAGTAYASKGIRVNCVCPGIVNTPLVPDHIKNNYRRMHPMHRIAEAFEIGSIITFLCSENARFITGAAIPVDGGYTSL